MTTEAIALKPLSPHFPYFADSFLSAGMGIICILFAAPMTTLIGWSLPAEFLIGIGIFLIPWGGMNYLTSQIPHPSRGILLSNIAGDTSWIIGSVIVTILTMASLSTIGWTFMIAQALGVLSMVLMKLRSLGAFYP